MQPFKFIRVLAVVACFLSYSKAQEVNKPHNVLYFQPVLTLITSSFSDSRVISIAYERQLGENGLSFFIPIHGAYFEEKQENFFALGSGLGLRKYIGYAFQGSYFTLQSDYIKYGGNRPRCSEISNYYCDTFTYPYSNDFLSITQLSFGYKWMWKVISLDLSMGGAFYAQEDYKHTSVIGAANVGFPFGKKTMGL